MLYAIFLFCASVLVVLVHTRLFVLTYLKISNSMRVPPPSLPASTDPQHSHCVKWFGGSKSDLADTILC